VLRVEYCGFIEKRGGGDLRGSGREGNKTLKSSGQQGKAPSLQFSSTSRRSVHVCYGQGEGKGVGGWGENLPYVVGMGGGLDRTGNHTRSPASSEKEKREEWDEPDVQRGANQRSGKEVNRRGSSSGKEGNKE